MINNNEKRTTSSSSTTATTTITPSTIGTKAQSMENRLETIFIKDIIAGMKNFTITCIVLEVGQPVMLKENREVRTVKVADQTACINLAVWDDVGHVINASDILRLTKAYAIHYRNSLTLYTAKVGSVEKIGEFTMVFNDQLNMSEMVHPPPSNNPPPNGNNSTNATSGYGVAARNSSLATNSHAAAASAAGTAGPPSHSASSSSSSRYNESSRTTNPRNGQQSDEPPIVVNPRSRTERR